MKISVCIPMYNESAIIRSSAQTLHKYMSENFRDGDWEVLFCDDGSTDGTADALRELGLSGVKITGYEKNRGKGSAVRHAMLEAGGDIIMFTDADLAYGTEIIARVLEVFDKTPDADIVIGSRNISADGYEGYTFARKLASKIYIKVLCLVGGFRLSDSQCGCKAFRHDVAKKIFSRCEVDGWAFDFEIILRAGKYGYKIAQMPVKVINHGASKVSLVKDALGMLGDLWRMKKKIKKEKDII